MLNISLGHWPVGSLIPKETELARQYNVSRDTVRQALQEIANAGYIERKPHVGTRVKSKTLSGRFVNEVLDIRDLDHYGARYPRVIQNVEKVVISHSQSIMLGVEPGCEMIRFENIRIASETLMDAVVVTYVYVPLAAARVVSWARKSQDRLIASLVEESTGINCCEVRQTFSATEMPTRAAELFKVLPHSPCLRIIRSYLDEAGNLLTVSESYHPADKFAFTVSARRTPLPS